MAGFEITKIVKEFVQLDKPKDGEIGMSFGEALDAQMLNIARAGGVVQTVALQVDESEWFDFAKSINPPTSIGSDMQKYEPHVEEATYKPKARKIPYGARKNF